MAVKDKTQSLLSGTLPTMQETGKPIADATANLQTLKGQHHPGTLPLFQKTMQGISERVYKARQSSDMQAIGGTMNPSQVSGGTMSSILGWLEGNRGKDVSSMYSSTMQGFMKSQEMISGEIKYLTEMRYNMKNDLDKFKIDLSKNFPGVFNDLSSKEQQDMEGGVIPDSLYKKMDTWSKDVYEREMKWEEEDREMERAINEIDIEYKTAQTDKIKSEAKEKLDIAQNFMEDVKSMNSSLAKLRKPSWTYEGVETPSVKPYNTQEEVQEELLKFKSKYGGKVEDDTMFAIDEYMNNNLSPEERNPSPVGVVTAEAKSEMELVQRLQESDAVVSRMERMYGDEYGDKYEILRKLYASDEAGNKEQAKRLSEALDLQMAYPE